MNIANLITAGRFVLVFVLVGMVYDAPPPWQLANPVLLTIIIALDGLDGYIARKRGESSLFGSVFDIAVDRVVENVLWIVLADLDLIPVWVALVFITRSLLVDSVRCHGAARGQNAFAMLRTPLARFLVAGRFMRGFYGFVKAAAFAWILLLQPWPAVFPSLWSAWSGPMTLTGEILVYLAVAVCLVRGVPVLLEFVVSEGLKRPPQHMGEPR